METDTAVMDLEGYYHLLEEYESISDVMVQKDIHPNKVGESISCRSD